MLYETVFRDFEEPMTKKRLDEMIAEDKKRSTDGEG